MSDIDLDKIEAAARAEIEARQRKPELNELGRVRPTWNDFLRVASPDAVLELIGRIRADEAARDLALANLRREIAASDRAAQQQRAKGWSTLAQGNESFARGISYAVAAIEKGGNLPWDPDMTTRGRAASTDGH